MFQKIFQQVTRKKTVFNGCIYNFSVDYDSIDVKNIKYIHKHLMKKNKIVYKYSNLLRKYFFNNDYQKMMFIKRESIKMGFNEQ